MDRAKPLLIALAGVVVLGIAAAASADTIRLNAADQATAKKIVLTKADLGPSWKGGAKKPDLSSNTRLQELPPEGLRPRRYRCGRDEL